MKTCSLPDTKKRVHLTRWRFRAYKLLTRAQLYVPTVLYSCLWPVCTDDRAAGLCVRHVGIRGAGNSQPVSQALVDRKTDF